MLTGIVVAAALLRFSTLDLQSFWFDETVTVVDDLQPGLWDTLVGVAELDATPPLYFVLAWGWAQIFGEGEVGLRSLSALFGTATVPVAYLIGLRLASARAGLILAALFAASPLMLWFGQDARAYAVLIFFGALTVLLFVRALDERTPRAVGLWALACAPVLLTHYFGGILVAVEGLWLLAVGPRRPVLAAGAALAAVQAALVPLLLKQWDNGGTDWVDDAFLIDRLKDIPDRFVVGPRDVLSDAHLGLAMIAIVLCGLLIAALVARSLRAAPERAPLDRRELRAVGLLTLLGGGTILLPMLIALAGPDVLLWRYLTLAWLPLAGVVAVVFGARRAGLLGLGAGAAAALVLLAMSIMTLTQERLHRENWREASALIGPPSGDRVIAVADWIEKEPIMAYGHDIVGMPRTGHPVREIVVVGQLHLWNTGGALSGKPASREPARFDPPPPGFRLTDYWQLERLSVLRFRADTPQHVTTEELWRTNRIPPEAVVVEPGPR